MFQQLLVNKHHRLRDSKTSPKLDLAEWRSASGHRHKLRHSNSGREKFGSAYRTTEPRSAHGRAVKNSGAAISVH